MNLAPAIRFATAIAAVGLVWLVVLPLVARQSSVARHIEAQQQRGIDPSAMFYSELEILPPIAHRMERLQLHRSREHLAP